MPPRGRPSRRGPATSSSSTSPVTPGSKAKWYVVEVDEKVLDAEGPRRGAARREEREDSVPRAPARRDRPRRLLRDVAGTRPRRRPSGRRSGSAEGALPGPPGVTSRRRGTPMNGLPLLPDAEWLETNGLGGFALSTVSGTQRPPVPRPPRGGDDAADRPRRPPREARGDARRRRRAVRPLGQPIRGPPPSPRRPPPARLPLRPVPDVGVTRSESVRLRRTFFLVHGEETAVVSWELTSEPAGPVRLEVRPLLAYRGHHELRGAGNAVRPGRRREEGAVRLHPVPGLPDLRLAHDAESVSETFFWYRGLEYDLDRERGFEFTEDLFSPLSFAWDLSARREATLVATLGSRTAAEVAALRAAEEKRRRRVEGAGSDRRLLRLLRAAADRFVVKRGEGWTIIAGYPWFTDWGRDAMIALPGLLLATRRFDVARSVLETFARLRRPRHGPEPLPRRGDRARVQQRRRDALVRRGGPRLPRGDPRRGVPPAGLPAPRRDRRASPARHPLRHPRRRRRPPLLRRAGAAADLDGRQGRRARRHPAQRQAGGGPGALAQRPAHRRALRGRTSATPSPRPASSPSPTRRARASARSSGTRSPGTSPTSSRPTGRATSRSAPTSSSPSRSTARSSRAPARRASSRAVEERLLTPYGAPDPRPRAPRLPRPLRGRPRRARRRLPPGNRLALAPRPARRRPPRRPRELPREPEDGRRVARARSSSTSSVPASASSRRSSTATRRTAPAAAWRRPGASARCCGRS